MQASQDSVTIAALRDKLNTLPAMINEGIRKGLCALVPAQLQQLFAQPAPAAFVAQGFATAQQVAETQGAAHTVRAAKSAGKVEIPIPCVAVECTSINGVWTEWTSSTTSRPSYSQMYKDHGGAWLTKKYGYEKQVWMRKRKLICAVLGLKVIKQADVQTALDILKRKEKSSGRNLNRFAESLPCLDAKIYPNGRHSIEKGGLSDASSDIAAQYQQYLGDLSNKLMLRDDTTMY